MLKYDVFLERYYKILHIRLYVDVYVILTLKRFQSLKQKK